MGLEVDGGAEAEEADGAEDDGDEDEGEAELGLVDAAVLAGEDEADVVVERAGDDLAEDGKDEGGDRDEPRLGDGEVIGRGGEDDAVDDAEDDDPRQGGAVDEEPPEHGRVEEEQHRPRVDLPDGRVAVAAREDAQRLEVRHLGLGRGVRGRVGEVLFRLAGALRAVVLVADLHVHGDLGAGLLHLVVVAPALLGDHNDGVAAVRRLRHEEDDGEHEDAEEDGANTERPAVPVVLDDVAADERAARDAGEQEEVPDSDARRALVDEVEVADGALDQDLVGRHADAADDAAGEEGVVLRRRGAPDAAHKHDDDGEDVDGPLAPELGQRVEDEEREADHEDQPRRRLRQRLDRDVERRGDDDEAGRQHGPVGADDGGGEADDEQDHFFLPLRPLMGERVSVSSRVSVLPLGIG